MNSMKYAAFVRVLQVNRSQIYLRLGRFRSTTYLKQEGHQHEKSSVDEHDIELYNALASRWWDERGEMKALHALNKLRVPLIRDGLLNVCQIDVTLCLSPQPLHGMKILEVGCGGGILTEPLARIGANVTGIDASQNMIDTARSHACEDPSVSDSITYVCGTIEGHANEHKEFYDAVVASEVLEHVVHKDLFLDACVSSLKPGGSIFITTLNRTALMWAFGIVMAEYVLRLVPHGTHKLDKCVKPHELEALLEKHSRCDDMSQSPPLAMELQHDFSFADLKCHVRTLLGLPEDGEVVMKLRRIDGTLVPLSCLLVGSSETEPFILDIVRIHQNTPASMRSAFPPSYIETVRSKLRCLEQRVERVESLIPELRSRRQASVERVLNQLASKVHFLDKRLDELVPSEWKGQLQ